MNLTFEQLLTPEGIVIFAGVVTGFVALLKGVFSVINDRVSGALMAFVVTLIAYVLCAFAVNADTLNEVLTVFIAWLACATSSVGIHSATLHTANSLTNRPD